MSTFIDSGIFVAFHNLRDENHDRALNLIRKAASGEFGIVYTSDYVFDESVTTALIRTNNPSIAQSLGEMILGGPKTPTFIIMLKVDSEIFKKSWELFVKYAEKGLSFTDCTSIMLIKSRGIDSIISFDSDFDGLVPRIY
ncbi:MAG: type II toxin-antitoxin system VapC family toxin [Candidatus Jordarchaeaceae archaeon]